MKYLLEVSPSADENMFAVEKKKTPVFRPGFYSDYYISNFFAPYLASA
jgi:hypothetical protein